MRDSDDFDAQLRRALRDAVADWSPDVDAARAELAARQAASRRPYRLRQPRRGREAIAGSGEPTEIDDVFTRARSHQKATRRRDAERAVKVAVARAASLVVVVGLVVSGATLAGRLAAGRDEPSAAPT